MSANLQRHHEFTEKEYHHHEQISLAKSEFYQGQIYAMAGASTTHNDISMSVGSSLDNQLDGKPCVPRISDQLLKIEATTLQTYPDVLVACPPFRTDPNYPNTLTDATVIIEVLSRSTANYDRNEKFDNYKRLDSLRHYVLIEQKQMKVTHHFLDADDKWQSETFTAPEDVVELRAIECQLVLRQIYKRVSFDETAGATI